MGYCISLWVKTLQKYQKSKLEFEKNLPDQPGPGCISLEPGWVGNFLSTSNFDLWYFCSLLTYKSVQYLIWKIWFISIWSLKARAMAQLIMQFMFPQGTLISYHTEAFVKTEVGCTVIHNQLQSNLPFGNSSFSKGVSNFVSRWLRNEMCLKCSIKTATSKQFLCLDKSCLDKCCRLKESRGGITSYFFLANLSWFTLKPSWEL